MNKLLSVRCPQCGQKALWRDNPDRPFCSERCRLIDLGRWSDEDYRIAGEQVPPEDEEADH